LPEAFPSAVKDSIKATTGYLLLWLPLAMVVALLSGSAAALFLWLLEWATDTRNANRWLIALLPLGGFAVGWLYHKYGESVAAGNDLLITELARPGKTIPFRMAPMVLFGTIVSHLFGGSAGREGTAVQMGGTLSDQLSRIGTWSHDNRRILLKMGVAGGFGGLFGTPLAAAIFALEFLANERFRNRALLPCLVAAILADQWVHWIGLTHVQYEVPYVPDFTLLGFGSALIAGVSFGLVGMTFAATMHGVKNLFTRWIAYPPLRPFAGGVLVAGAVLLTGADRYIGLGLPVIVEAFHQPLPIWDSILKFAFTVVTLGSGFKGGEVTPLFYIGATLGNALSPLLALPMPVLAGLGLVAVFAGAAKTPIACTIMAVELFGGEIAMYAFVACMVAWWSSGSIGIYPSQNRIKEMQSRQEP
jgi:H+/Cl- antiporter ClcA